MEDRQPAVARQFSRLTSSTTSECGQDRQLGMTHETPLPERVGAYRAQCSWPGNVRYLPPARPRMMAGSSVIGPLDRHQPAALPHFSPRMLCDVGNSDGDGLGVLPGGDGVSRHGFQNLDEQLAACIPYDLSLRIFFRPKIGR